MLESKKLKQQGEGFEDKGAFGKILEKISISCDKTFSKIESMDTDGMIQRNARNTKRELLNRSKTIKEKYVKGKIKIVTCEYYLDSGLLKIIIFA